MNTSHDGSDRAECFSCSATFVGTTARVYLHGDLDLAGVPILRQQLDDPAVRDARVLVFDATDLSFCDSSGLHLLLGVAARCARNGKEMRLFGVNGVVARIIQITDTAAALNQTDTDGERTRGGNVREKSATIRARSIELQRAARQVRGQHDAG